jgi:PKD repeat protein
MRSFLGILLAFFIVGVAAFSERPTVPRHRTPQATSASRQMETPRGLTVSYQHETRHPEPVKVEFPATFTEPARITSGMAVVSAKPLNANPASVREVQSDGRLIYRNAFRGCDVVYRSEPLKTEEFIVVKECETNALKFEWDLQFGQSVSPLAMRLTAMNTIEFCDAKGIARLRIDAPAGTDADGKHLRPGKELRYSLTDNKLVLNADLRQTRLPVTIDPTWSSTGSLSAGRYNHTATRLSDGKVLVTGGNNGGSTRDTCELYDPDSGTWTATGSMSVGREVHCAVLLPSNKVLVSGGSTDSGVTDACEIYDPGTGTWSATGSLNHARYLHSTTRMNDDTVLAVGGVFAGVSCEIFDETSGMWTAIGDTSDVRYQHTATLLADGRVLVAGGPEGGSSGEVFDPTLGTWSSTGALNTPRVFHSAELLASGKVLIAGGRTLDNSTYLSSCELFDPGTSTWSVAGSMANERPFIATAMLPNGTVLAVGGGPIASEVYHPDTGMWATSADMIESRSLPTVTRLENDTVLIAGGDSNTTSCELYELAPAAFADSETIDEDTSVAIVLRAESIDTPEFSIVTPPEHGTLSGTVPDIVYHPAANYFGSDSFEYSVSDSFGTSAPATISITINPVNDPPTVTAGASVSVAAPGEVITFTAEGMDVDGDALTYTWDFGDGNTSNDQNTLHSFSETGTYTVSVTVFDPSGEMASATLIVIIDFPPTARFTTDEVVAFVGIPQTFDATYSTDPENQIVAYDWNFGDGSHVGHGQAISKIYTSTGSYTVTLTVTDAVGLTSTAQRVIQVLNANQIGLFNGYVRYKVGWNRNATNADTLQMTAKVNVGDATVESGTNVKLEIVGQTYTGTLNGKLKDTSNSDVKWAVKASVRNEPFGTVVVSLKIKHADLGLGFNSAGAVQGGVNDFVEVDIPVRITIGSRVFEISVPSEFKFNGNGKKGRGTGES